eukprot:Lithocolla_globosa_v1_NODE_3107_length_1765_cov_3.964327.p1 type:complete len:177 gc:universal NODE_3107_length_1765_cov_3.964327:1149-1679(+)
MLLLIRSKARAKLTQQEREKLEAKTNVKDTFATNMQVLRSLGTFKRICFEDDLMRMCLEDRSCDELLSGNLRWRDKNTNSPGTVLVWARVYQMINTQLGSINPHLSSFYRNIASSMGRECTQYEQRVLSQLTSRRDGIRARITGNMMDADEYKFVMTELQLQVKTNPKAMSPSTYM